MTRGNQRDIDRARAQKRQEKKGDAKKEDFNKRKLTDAEIMREKQKKAEEKKQKEEEDAIIAAGGKIGGGASKDMSYMKQFEQMGLEEGEEGEEEKKKEEEVEAPKEMIKAGKGGASAAKK